MLVLRSFFIASYRSPQALTEKRSSCAGKKLKKKSKAVSSKMARLGSELQMMAIESYTGQQRKKEENKKRKNGTEADQFIIT